MSVFKRREWWLELPDGSRVQPFQASNPEAAQAKAAEIAGKAGLSEWKLYRDPEATYSCKFSWQGKQRLLDTRMRSLRDAEQFERRALEALAKGRSDVLAKAMLRQPDNATLAQIWQAYPEIATQQGVQPAVARQNLNSLALLIRRGSDLADGAEVGHFGLDALTAEIVYRFKAASLARLAGKPEDEIASGRRTANSILRQAKSVFTPHAREFYTIAKGVKLPASILEFSKAPGFADTIKRDYRIPSDKILKATFADLETRVRTEDVQVYIAAWMALGFGLRRSEIAAARVGWFVESEGKVRLELRSTIVRNSTTEKTSTKNGEQCPIVDPANGVMAKLAPLLKDRSPEEYLIATDKVAERTVDVFERLTAWLRGHGWETEKATHELRAYGGCQVAMRDGIEAASKWLRHSSILVTQRHYGRYLRPVVTDKALRIPS